MDEAFRIVIPNPSLTVILSKAKNLFISLRTGSVRNLVFSERDCHVAPLLAPVDNYIYGASNDSLKRIAQFRYE